MLRTRKFLSGFGVVGFLSLTLPVITSVLLAAPAYATGPLSAPDGNGAYGVCNINTFHDAANDHVPAGTGAHWQFRWRCNWGGPHGTGTGPNGVGEMVIKYEVQFRGAWGQGTVFRGPGMTQNECTGVSTHFPYDETTQTSSGCLQINTNDDAWNDNACIACASQGFSDFTIDRQRYFLASTCYEGTGACGTVYPERVQTYATSSAFPNVPNDWYSGGAAVDSTASPPVCSRTLTDTSAMTAQFHSGTVTATNATVTSAVWDYGDSTNSGTITSAGPFDKNHTYGALSTMPTNGWTATLTVTYTATSGHQFNSGSTGTTTCSLRVDFLNPSQTAPSGTGGNPGNGGTIDNPQGIDDCEPSGWGWLNPLSLVKGMFCLFKLAFIPSSSTSTSISSMWTGITTKAPFSVMYEVVTYIPANLQDFVDGVHDFSPMVSHGIGGPGTSPICGVDNGTPPGPTHTGLCNYSGSYPFEGGGPFRVDGGTGKPAAPVYLAREIMLFLFGVLFVYACYRGVAEILK